MTSSPLVKEFEEAKRRIGEIILSEQVIDGSKFP